MEKRNVPGIHRYDAPAGGAEAAVAWLDHDGARSLRGV